VPSFLRRKNHFSLFPSWLVPSRKPLVLSSQLLSREKTHLVSLLVCSLRIFSTTLGMASSTGIHDGLLLVIGCGLLGAILAMLLPRISIRVSPAAQETAEVEPASVSVGE
jgi:hypothetical protein